MQAAGRANSYVMTQLLCHEDVKPPSSIGTTHSDELSQPSRGAGHSVVLQCCHRRLGAQSILNPNLVLERLAASSEHAQVNMPR